MIRTLLAAVACATATTLTVPSASATTTAPVGPTGLHTSVVGPTSLQWVWDAYPNAEKYRVAISTTRDMARPEIRWTSNRFLTASGLARQQVYYVAVRAYGAWGASKASPVIASRTSPVPTGLRVTDRSSSHLAWQWTTYKDASRYEVRLSSDPAFAGYRTRIVAGATTVALSGLQADRTYYARVRAVDGNDRPTTGWSAVVSARTTAVSSG